MYTEKIYPGVRTVVTEKNFLLDFIFKDIATQLDLPKSKRELALERYNAVANWLDCCQEDDPLADIKIKIYPIGSFLSGTPVRPLKGDEFDLDMAGELQLNYGDYPDPRAAVDIFERRIRKNKIYDKIAERKTRVIRLNYSGDFYLDFMPCFPTLLFKEEDTQIKIPHKITETLYDYRDSNPLGLNLWFEDRCKIKMLEKVALAERKDNILMPIPEYDKHKEALKLALQVLKYLRNFYFYNDEEGQKAVSTVILKVLLGRGYNGTQNIYLFLRDSINRIFIEFYYIDHPVILNPINENEDFAEKWRLEPDRLGFKKFKGFIYFLKKMFEKMERAKSGFAELSEPLNELFGTVLVKKAFEKIGKKTLEATKVGKIAVTSTGLLTSSRISGTIPVKRHKFYGTI